MTRTGRIVRIEVTAGLDISEDACTAIIAATMEHLLDEDVSVVQLDLDGSALGPDLPKGFAAAVGTLELLAERYGKELMVGPIKGSVSPGFPALHGEPMV